MKNKRLAAGLLALTLVFGGAVLPENKAESVAVVSASADSAGFEDMRTERIGDFGFKYLQDGTLELESYVGKDEVVEVPDTVKGIKVTGIGNNAFTSKKTITDVIIPDGVTFIGASAFSNSENLKNVVIPEGVESIGNFAFENCKSLQSVKLPASLLTMGDGVFSCSGIVIISLPRNLRSFGVGEFYECKDLIAAYIPESVELIPECTFLNCEKLNDLVICDGVKKIDDNAFAGCTSLEQVMLPDSVTEVLQGSFNNSTIYCNSGSYGESFAIDNGLGLYLYDADMDIQPEITYEMGDGCVKLKWEAVEGADKYAVVGYADGKWKTIAQGTGTSYVLKGLKYNTNYRVAVFPRINGVWNRNSTNNILVRTYYTTPKIRDLGYNKEHDRFSVTWRPVDNAEKYAVCMYKDGKWIAKAYVDGSKNTFTSPKCDAGEYTMAICVKTGGKWYKNQLDNVKFTVNIK